MIPNFMQEHNVLSTLLPRDWFHYYTQLIHNFMLKTAKQYIIKWSAAKSYNTFKFNVYVQYMFTL